MHIYKKKKKLKTQVAAITLLVEDLQYQQVSFKREILTNELQSANLIEPMCKRPQRFREL